MVPGIKKIVIGVGIMAFAVICFRNRDTATNSHSTVHGGSSTFQFVEASPAVKAKTERFFEWFPWILGGALAIPLFLAILLFAIANAETKT